MWYMHVLGVRVEDLGSSAKKHGVGFRVQDFGFKVYAKGPQMYQAGDRPAACN